MKVYAEGARRRCLARLRELAESDDPEVAHSEADKALLDLVCDAEVAVAFEAVPKWYA